MCPQPNRLLSTTLICACWPTNSLTFHDAQSKVSLSLPVAVRTTCPLTTRFTVSSSDLGTAAVSVSMTWSRVRCPHPPVAWSTIRSWAFCPSNSETSQPFQFSNPPLPPARERTTSPLTSSSTARVCPESAERLPPPTNMLMNFFV